MLLDILFALLLREALNKIIVINIVNIYNHYCKPIYFNHYSLIYTVYTLDALSYICMSLQHPVTGPAAQVPDPDRLIP